MLINISNYCDEIREFNARKAHSREAPEYHNFVCQQIHAKEWPLQFKVQNRNINLKDSMNRK